MGSARSTHCIDTHYSRAQFICLPISQNKTKRLHGFVSRIQFIALPYILYVMHTDERAHKVLCKQTMQNQFHRIKLNLLKQQTCIFDITSIPLVAYGSDNLLCVITRTRCECKESVANLQMRECKALISLLNFR